MKRRKARWVPRGMLWCRSESGFQLNSLSVVGSSPYSSLEKSDLPSETSLNRVSKRSDLIVWSGEEMSGAPTGRMGKW